MIIKFSSFKRYRICLTLRVCKYYDFFFIANGIRLGYETDSLVCSYMALILIEKKYISIIYYVHFMFDDAISFLLATYLHKYIGIRTLLLFNV